VLSAKKLPLLCAKFVFFITKIHWFPYKRLQPLFFFFAGVFESVLELVEVAAVVGALLASTLSSAGGFSSSEVGASALLGVTVSELPLLLLIKFTTASKASETLVLVFALVSKNEQYSPY